MSIVLYSHKLLVKPGNEGGRRNTSTIRSLSARFASANLQTAAPIIRVCVCVELSPALALSVPSRAGTLSFLAIMSIHTWINEGS